MKMSAVTSNRGGQIAVPRAAGLKAAVALLSFRRERIGAQRGGRPYFAALAAAAALRAAASRASQESSPSPDFAETSSSLMLGCTERMLFSAATASNSTADARSIFVITATSAV